VWSLEYSIYEHVLTTTVDLFRQIDTRCAGLKIGHGELLVAELLGGPGDFLRAFRERSHDSSVSSDGAIFMQRCGMSEHDILPPAVTVRGAQTLMKRLCEQAEIDVEDGYLKLHGARQGLGDLLPGIG
jgi:hypothetical protein